MMKRGYLWGTFGVDFYSGAGELFVLWNRWGRVRHSRKRIARLKRKLKKERINR